MPPAHRGPTGSPMDRWTDASPSAIASGFNAAMAIGPQPKLNPHPASGLSHSLSARSLASAGDLNTDDEEDEDDDDDDDGSPAASGSSNKKAAGKGGAGGGKKGSGGGRGGKDPKAAQHRKEQNRAAQREFRQRKQQYIRALEARVELLSSDHDTQVDRLRYALRHLLAENNSLRTMVGNLAHFIGKRSLGGCLAESGMSREELEIAVGSSSEKTMSEAWANWPGAHECEALKQIRKESNIPLDGLPESKLSNYMRDSATKGSTSAPTTTCENDSKKRAQDDESTNNPNESGKNTGSATKRKRKTDEGNAVAISTSTTTDKASTSTTTKNSVNSSQLTSQTSASGAAGMPSTGPTSQQAWQQQQQQQPSNYGYQQAEAWQANQPTPTNQLRNDVDSMFIQNLLGGSGPISASPIDAYAAFGSGMVPQTPMSQAMFTPGGINFNPAMLGGMMTGNGNGGGAAGFFSGNPDAQQSSATSDFLNASGAAAGLMAGSGFYPGPAGGGGTGNTPSNNSNMSNSNLPGSVGGSPALNNETRSGPGTPRLTGSDSQLSRDSPDSNRSRPVPRVPLEALRDVRLRVAHMIALVNRVWAKKGGTVFLDLPPQVKAQGLNIKSIEAEETTNPHLKLAAIPLPNGWDEGDMSHPGQNGGQGSHDLANAAVEQSVEAFVQLSYHMSNYHSSSSYALPPLLKPTPLQLATPHDIIIDGLPWPSLRDNLLRNPQLSYQDVLVDVLRFSTSHGDITIERNWELRYPFLIRYPELIDDNILSSANRYRATRGEPQLSMEQIWNEHRQFAQYTKAKLQELQ
ncbi:hypothetical protein BCV70DRAFT_201751 [Testicularia cyperi]|uniref:BZIP domain-containing protein n=1 Tax=Testicularia cyperi TaxID=1882483 RepID=A0A317XKQ0_9BASI|nr:hypothetical protein BCV70DRAFT_201751 [Testicularia cyperi]